MAMKSSDINIGMSNYFQLFQDLSTKIFFALKIDARTRCLTHLDAMKYTNYFCPEESIEPEKWTSKLNLDLENIQSVYKKYLPKTKSDYLFEGLGLLISESMINILPKLRCKIFNHHGINLIKKSSLAIQQNLSDLVPMKELDFTKVRNYYDLLLLTEKELFQNVNDKTEFNLAQFKSILNTEGPNRALSLSAPLTLVELWSSK
jgi:hypothetical protein